jgi:hypothetical protein
MRRKSIKKEKQDQQHQQICSSSKTITSGGTTQLTVITATPNCLHCEENFSKTEIWIT